MKITIAKAIKLSAKVMALINKHDFTMPQVTSKVIVTEGNIGQLNVMQEAYTKAIEIEAEQKCKAIAAYFELRTFIAEHNAKTEAGRIIGEMACIDGAIKTVTAYKRNLSSYVKSSTVEEIRRAFDFNKRRMEKDATLALPDLESALDSAPAIAILDETLTKMRIERERLEDERNQINSAHFVVLSDDLAAYLKGVALA